jgi:hypothetical protein
MRNARSAALLLMLVCTSQAGCASLGEYFVERGKDFLDIFDIKAGVGIPGGLGLKINVTDYFGPGIGLADCEYGFEKYGRWTYSYGSYFFHLGIVGMDNLFPFPNGEFNFLGILIMHDLPEIEWYERLRVGFEIYLPFSYFGFYINFGEIADFFLGIFGYDLIDDNTRPWGKGTVRRVK